MIDKLSRELLAFAKLYKKEKEVKELSIDTKEFPDAIIEETMFELEEKLLGDKEVYFRDLVARLKEETRKRSLKDLHAQLKEPGADHDSIMKEMHSVAKGKES